MCVVSMVGDYYGQKWGPYFPAQPTTGQPNKWGPTFPVVPNAEIEQLRKEVQDLRELLKNALEYDKKNNEPHCEVEEKMAKLKAIAELVGLPLDDLLNKK